MSNRAMKQAMKDALQAKEQTSAETGGTAGGAILDNGPNDPATTEHETPSGSQTAKATDVAAQAVASAAAEASLKNEGREAGKKIKDAEAGAFGVFREIILVTAERFAKLGLNAKGDLTDTPVAWLEGFGEEVGKVKKSEVRAIFIAACIGSKTLNTGKYAKGDPAKGQDPKEDYVVSETHSGMEWMKLCTSYDEMKKRARDVKGKDGSRSNVVHIRTALTDKGLESAEKLVGGASAKQAQQIAQGALTKIQQSPEAPEMFLNIMLGACIRLQHEKDEDLKAFASGVASGCQELIGKITRSKAEDSVKVKPNMATMSTVVQAPAPAVAEIVAPVTEVLPEQKAA